MSEGLRGRGLHLVVIQVIPAGGGPDKEGVLVLVGVRVRHLVIPAGGGPDKEGVLVLIGVGVRHLVVTR